MERNANLPLGKGRAVKCLPKRVDFVRAVLVERLSPNE